MYYCQLYKLFDWVAVSLTDSVHDPSLILNPLLDIMKGKQRGINGGGIEEHEWKAKGKENDRTFTLFKIY